MNYQNSWIRNNIHSDIFLPAQILLSLCQTIKQLIAVLINRLQYYVWIVEDRVWLIWKIYDPELFSA